MIDEHNDGGLSHKDFHALGEASRITRHNYL